MYVRLFALIVVCLLSAVTAGAQVVLENQTQVMLADHRSMVKLVVDSPAAMPVSAKVEFVEPSGAVKATAEDSRQLIAGRNEVELPAPIEAMIGSKEFPYYTLRYQVGSSSGAVAMSRFAPDMFDLEAFGFTSVHAGSRYRTRVRAIHPILFRGVAGVKLTGTLKVEFEDGTSAEYSTSTATDAGGFGDLSFQLPVGAKVEDAQFKLSGAKNGLSRDLSLDVDNDDLRDYSFVYFQTDKPIYQPSQMLHVRSLFFDWNGKPLVNEQLTFTIKDPDGTMLQRFEARTSRFGIASVDWQIPDSSRLGEYTVAVSSSRRLATESRSFKVSRYELPNFTVSAKPDRQYYLPDRQFASVTVRADYLFGKPVSTARVRVVEETSRYWDFAAQKYETKEGQVREGELAADGSFIAEFDLAKRHEDFEEWRSNKFEDIHFAAYVTDLTTNKTEQKRFDIRITKQPIHVYLTGLEEDLSKRQSGKFYVTTFYADGTPVECDLAIYKADDDDEDKPGKRILKTKTNRLGATKVSVPFDKVLGEDDDDLDLVMVADDRHGHKGRLSQDLDFDGDKPAVRVTTDKLIYRKGDPIKLSVTSSEQNADLFVDVRRRDRTISTDHVKVSGGHGSMVIPYSGDLKHEVMVAVYGTYLDSDGSTEIYVDNKTILYPVANNFVVNASTDGDTFRPGSEANLKLSATDGAGNPLEAAFGVSVIDKAIEERARTDSEFGSGYRSFYSDFEDFLGLSLGSFGLTGQMVDNMDTSRQLLPEVELAIEIVLSRRYEPELEHSGNFQSGMDSAYRNHFTNQFAKVRAALRHQFDNAGTTAMDPDLFRRILKQNDIDFDTMRDPWGNQFDVRTSRYRQNVDVTVVSSGPDETIGTSDDANVFTDRFEYFRPTGHVISDAFVRYHARTGDYLRDYKTLRNELKQNGLEIESLRDAWGQKYKFEFTVQGYDLVLSIGSGGWDKKFGGYDDFPIWTHRSDYFQVLRADMGAAFRKYVGETGSFPIDENEFRKVMRDRGYDVDKLKDLYRRNYYVAREVVPNRAVRRLIAARKTTSVATTPQDFVAYVVKSAGADGVRGNSDDFELTRFIGVREKPADASGKTQRAKAVSASLSDRGAIAGVVMDPMGAVIPNASIIVTANRGRIEFRTQTDAEGEFTIGELPAGVYSVRMDSPGFKTLIIQSISVESQTTAELELTLDVGSVNEAVMVASSGELIDMTTNTTGSNITTEFFSNIPMSRTVQGLYTIAPGVARSGLRDASGRDRDPSVAGSSGPENSYILDGANTAGDSPAKRPMQELATPRLREYFPETLLWLPELVSQANGTAELRVKLADSITKWKVAVIASTANGDVGIAEKEITAFQPFFVDLDPPKFLTEGDVISLPVQIRNYTEAKQSVDVSMASGDWFSLTGSNKQTIAVDAGGTQNAVFPFRADAVVTDGKQRVTAYANNESDAIEKPVTVRPDGQEVVRTESKLFRGRETFQLSYPENARPGTQKATAKIYPNLFSHVAESVEGLLQRPYGCGEQTISSTYPNLMILKFVKGDTPLRRSAKKYLRSGYERLIGYQGTDGGFSYWGAKDSSNVALTAFAVRFLNDAKEHTAVDESLIKRAEEYLVKQQAAGGTWARYGNGDAGSLMDTVYVARSLAMRKSGNLEPATSAALRKAFVFLNTNRRSITDPYTQALLGLALLDSGETESARVIAAHLQTKAVAEGDAAYWSLETSTPFYGWGTTGRVETTALVTQLLTRVFGQEQSSAGTLYLLKNKDRYGVWHSTQTTINVLDALLATLATSTEQTPRSIQVSLNGANVQTVNVNEERVEPIVLDLSDKLDPRSNVLEVRSTSASPLMVQTVATHYIDWQDAQLNRENNLQISYNCDKLEAAIMSDITCSVELGQRTWRGYGMLLAEIGTPPGADVSRESLERALKENPVISRYDILPDRIVFYLWSNPRSTKFTFTFRPRYGIDAKTPASTVYDYYNPEAHAVQAPLRFVVR